MGIVSSAFRMNIWLRAFCYAVMYLDHIPRYGRLYRMDTKLSEYEGEGFPPRTRIWRYQPMGRWGWNLLNKMGLLWPYLKHHNPDL
jgi:hypothetical protein